MMTTSALAGSFLCDRYPASGRSPRSQNGSLSLGNRDADCFEAIQKSRANAELLISRWGGRSDEDQLASDLHASPCGRCNATVHGGADAVTRCSIAAPSLGLRAGSSHTPSVYSPTTWYVRSAPK